MKRPAWRIAGCLFVCCGQRVDLLACDDDMIDARRRHASAFIDNGDHGRDVCNPRILIGQSSSGSMEDIVLKLERL